MALTKFKRLGILIELIIINSVGLIKGHDFIAALDLLILQIHRATWQIIIAFFDQTIKFSLSENGISSCISFTDSQTLEMIFIM